MRTRRELMALMLGGVMIAGVTAVLAVNHEALLAPRQTATEAQPGGLKIASIEQMCQTLGASEGDALKQCQTDEQAAGEFVFAWMAFNNFIVNGEISLEQIQLIASLDQPDAFAGLASDPSLPSDPGLGFDPSGLGDPSASASQITAGIDPATGTPLGYLQSPAELALFCFQMAGDWVTLHDCISENDPSSHIGGVQ
jgi:hypothetical protein